MTYSEHITVDEFRANLERRGASHAPNGAIYRIIPWGIDNEPAEKRAPEDGKAYQPGLFE